jgi:hypothetical protein
VAIRVGIVDRYQPGGSKPSEDNEGQLHLVSNDLEREIISLDFDNEQDFTNTYSGSDKNGKKGEKNQEKCRKDFQHIEELWPERWRIALLPA